MSGGNGRILIMAGGTGGHIFPGLAVADALLEAGAEVRWLGAIGGMECERVPAHGIAIEQVHIRGLRGKGLWGWLAAPFRLARAVRDAGRVLAALRPDCAVSFGGYVAGPGGIAARLRGIPLVVHEQNRIPGLTNRVLGRICQQLLQAFPGSFPGDRAITCGNPVRAAVASLPVPEMRWENRDGPARLLVTGGSQGARALNQLVPAAMTALAPDLAIEVRHQAGHDGLQATRSAYGQTRLQARVSAFIDDMAEAYAWADLVVCRAGALTVSELAAAGLGAVLVPFPHAVDDHQTANARYLADAGAAILLPEQGLTAAQLAGALRPLLEDRGRALDMARTARGLAIPNAADSVAKACLQWVAA